MSCNGTDRSINRLELYSESSDDESYQEDFKKDEQGEADTRNDFEVHLNSSYVEEEMCGSKTLAEFTEEFASWEPNAETCR